MLIDYSNASNNVIDCFTKQLKMNGKIENTSFFSLDNLWEEISFCIKNKKFNFFFNFNGKFIILEDDNLTEDEVYKFICGKTKQEKEELDKKWVEEYRCKEKEWKEKIPSLIPKYIEQGHKILDEKYWEMYDKCVPIRLGDLYHGFDLDTFLEIVEMSNKNVSFEEIQNKFYEQGHSNMSYALVRAMYKELTDRGKEYYNWSIKK